MMFKQVLFDDFESMLLQKLLLACMEYFQSICKLLLEHPNVIQFIGKFLLRIVKKCNSPTTEI